MDLVALDTLVSNISKEFKHNVRSVLFVQWCYVAVQRQAINILKAIREY